MGSAQGPARRGLCGPEGGTRAEHVRLRRLTGVGCEHCHEVGIWGDDSKPQKGLTFKMISLFEEMTTYFEGARMPRFQCFLCHQGKVKPER